MEDELVVIAAANDPAAEAGMVTAAELSAMPFVLPSSDSASGESVLDQVHAAGIDLHSVLKFGNVGAVKKAVEEGMGVSIVSRYAVARELDDGRLKALRSKACALPAM
jgi:DNA-binding transcriptional LysR family regulator